MDELRQVEEELFHLFSNLPASYVSQYHQWLTGGGPLPNIHNVVIK